MGLLGWLAGSRARVPSCHDERIAIAARPMLRGLKALADAQSALPATRTAQLAGGPMEYVVAGDGEPTVVLIGGLGVPIDGWALVLPELARTATVIAFNRRGPGFPAQARPQTGSAVVDLLRELLAAAGAPPPYVLVGHAVGGLYANLFARRFPHELAGLVLLEPTHPADELHERRLRFLPPARRAEVAAPTSSSSCARRPRRSSGPVRSPTSR